MLLVKMLLILAGLQSNVSFWCTHGLENVFQNTPRPPNAAQQIVVSAARNQTVCAQIVISSPSPPVLGFLNSVTCSTLRHAWSNATIGPDAFTCRWVEYQFIEQKSLYTPSGELTREAPDFFPDGLISPVGQKFAPTLSQPLWVSFQVPRNTPPGLYAGKITVQINDVNTNQIVAKIDVPVRLTVYDFDFPDSTQLNVSLWIGDFDRFVKGMNSSKDDPKFWNTILPNVANQMREHHQNVFWADWMRPYIVGKMINGRLVLNYSMFDRWVQTFLDAGFRRFEIRHIGGNVPAHIYEQPMVVDDPTPTDPDNKTYLYLEDWLPLLYEHLQVKGWLSKAMIHVATEPNPVNIGDWQDIFRRVRAVAPDLRRIDDFTIDAQTYIKTQVKPYIDTWVPHLMLYAIDDIRTFLAKEQQAGAEMWLYTTGPTLEGGGKYPARLLDFPLIKTRILHWLNFTGGTTGYLNWALCYWDLEWNPTTNRWEFVFVEGPFAPGDSWIVRPGVDRLTSTLRYEAMREGIEDYEYMMMLEDEAGTVAVQVNAQGFDAHEWMLGFAQLVTLATPSAKMSEYTDYTREPNRLYAVRDAIARAIISLKGPLPAAAWAKRDVAGSVRVSGFTMPGATLSIGGKALADGRFERVLSPRQLGRGSELILEVKSGNLSKKLYLTIIE